jgi:nitroreductase
MDFFKLVEKRYSVREFKPNTIPETDLKDILEAARMAPSAKNRQPIRIIVIRTADCEEGLLRIYNHNWFVQPAQMLAVVAVPSEGWVRDDGKNYAEQDAVVAMAYITLAAANLKLGTHWISAFDPDVAREVLGLPADVEPIAFTPLGYPNDKPESKKRKSLDELVRYDHW